MTVTQLGLDPLRHITKQHAANQIKIHTDKPHNVNSLYPHPFPTPLSMSTFQTPFYTILVFTPISTR